MTPSGSVCESPREALTSESDTKIYSQRSENQSDVNDSRGHPVRLVPPDPISHTVSGLSSEPPPVQVKKSVPQVLNDFPTPLEMSSNLSQSSSAEDPKFPRAPFSTHEQISGKPSDVAPAIKEQYVRSIVNEPGEMVGTGGSLPGYPGPAALSALIGERIYDEHMRASGGIFSINSTFTCLLIISFLAREPIQTTTNISQRQSLPRLAAPQTSIFVPKCTAEEDPLQPDVGQMHLTSQFQSAAKPQISNASTAEYYSAPETSPTLAGASIDLSSGVGISSSAGQPTTTLNPLVSSQSEEFLLHVDSEPDVQSSRARLPPSSAIPFVARRPAGRGFGVGDLGKPIISGETVRLLLSA